MYPVHDQIAKEIDDLNDYSVEEAKSYVHAVGSGVAASATNMIQTILHPIDHFIIPLAQLARNVAIASGGQLGIAIRQANGQFQVITIVDRNSQAYNESVNELYLPINSFKIASTPQQVKIATEFICNIFMPGYLLKAGKATINKYRFGEINPSKFHTDNIDAPWMKPTKIDGLTVKEIRENYSNVQLMYVIRENGKLVITAQTHDHWHLGQGRPVRAAGDLYIDAQGKISRVDTRSGSYVPKGNLKTVIETIFTREGFPDVVGRYVDFFHEMEIFGAPFPHIPVITRDIFAIPSYFDLRVGLAYGLQQTFSCSAPGGWDAFNLDEITQVATEFFAAKAENLKINYENTMLWSSKLMQYIPNFGDLWMPSAHAYECEKIYEVDANGYAIGTSSKQSSQLQSFQSHAKRMCSVSDDSLPLQRMTNTLLHALPLEIYPHTPVTKMQLLWRIWEMDNPNKLLHSVPEALRKRIDQEINKEIALAGGWLAYAKKRNPRTVAFVKALKRGLKTIAEGFAPEAPPIEEIYSPMPEQVRQSDSRVTLFQPERPPIITEPDDIAVALPEPDYMRRLRDFAAQDRSTPVDITTMHSKLAESDFMTTLRQCQLSQSLPVSHAAPLEGVMQVLQKQAKETASTIAARNLIQLSEQRVTTVLASNGLTISNSNEVRGQIESYLAQNPITETQLETMQEESERTVQTLQRIKEQPLPGAELTDVRYRISGQHQVAREAFGNQNFVQGLFGNAPARPAVHAQIQGSNSRKRESSFTFTFSCNIL